MTGLRSGRVGGRPSEVFLIGGGRDADALVAAHAGLAQALAGRPLLCLVADEGDGIDADRWRGMLTDAGVTHLDVAPIATDRFPHASDLTAMGGLYVAGGLTPLYARLLTPLRAALRPGLVYGGFSAGASVAARRALVGGWLLEGRAVCDEEVSEDLADVTVVDGLGIVPFTVEVHATQWGTLSRSLHAVAAGLAIEAWALDENTGLHVVDGVVEGIQGVGHAYRITRSTRGVHVEPRTAGPA